MDDFEFDQYLIDTIKQGTWFETEYEPDCLATSKPDRWGYFLAEDSGGNESTFHVGMVSKIFPEEGVRDGDAVL